MLTFSIPNSPKLINILKDWHRIDCKYGHYYILKITEGIIEFLHHKNLLTYGVLISAKIILCTFLKICNSPSIPWIQTQSWEKNAVDEGSLTLIFRLSWAQLRELTSPFSTEKPLLWTSQLFLYFFCLGGLHKKARMSTKH